jgi:hypothetical protein
VNFPTDPTLPLFSAQPVPPPAPPAESDELTDWKASLRRDFETWLASLDEIPQAEAAPDDSADAPDLFSFYEQLAAANVEARKANRRTAEAFSQWSETLTRFEGSLAPLRETAAHLAAAQPREAGLSRPHCLVLVELLDRLHRLGRAFQTPPVATRKSWWSAGNDDAWQKAWDAQRQAFDILVSHLEGWLKKEGVTRLETLGEPFDPVVMLAVAAEPDATRPAQTVIEEAAAGFLRHGELLRAAQVKVTRKP